MSAAVAIQPNLLYGYALEAGIKELTTVSLLLILLALFAERLPGDGWRQTVMPPAVASRPLPYPPATSPAPAPPTQMAIPPP